MRGNTASSGKDIIGNPFHNYPSVRRGGHCTVAGIFGLHVSHLLFDFFGADVTAEYGGNSQVPPLPGVRRCHHVLRIKHLLGQFRHIDVAELVASPRNQRRESDHEEVQAGERNHIDGKFAEIRVQLTWKTETSSNTGHDQ